MAQASTRRREALFARQGGANKQKRRRPEVAVFFTVPGTGFFKKHTAEDDDAPK
jgi:hypothetical protein